MNHSKIVLGRVASPDHSGVATRKHTAVDDFSRWPVLEIYKQRTAKNIIPFLDLLLEQFPYCVLIRGKSSVDACPLDPQFPKLLPSLLKKC